MSQEIVKLIEDLNKDLEEVDAVEFPCKAKFKKIGRHLNSFKSGVSGDLPGETVTEAKNLLSSFHEILKECLEHKDETCAGNFKAISAKARLRKLTKRLARLQGGSTAHVTAPTAGSKLEGRLQVEPNQYEIDNYQWTSSFIELEKIYGMEQQVTDIVERLEKTTSFDAVGIVGMQGSGKTALAQKVFMDEKIMDKFALRLWVCVSPHHGQPEEVLLRMLDNLGLDLGEVDRIVKESEEKDKLEKVGVLLFMLYMVLLDNSYLIVFDDVWSTDPWYGNLALPAPMDREWTERLAYGLPKDDLGEGSAVIVTSRSEDVARAMVGSGGLVHRMKPMQDELLEDGWTVFEKAFMEEALNTEKAPKKAEEGQKAEEEEKKTEETQKKAEEVQRNAAEAQKEAEKYLEDIKIFKRLIVEKCNGLPLAMKVAGRGLARQRKNEHNDMPPTTPTTPATPPPPWNVSS